MARDRGSSRAGLKRSASRPSRSPWRIAEAWNAHLPQAAEAFAKLHWSTMSTNTYKQASPTEERITMVVVDDSPNFVQAVCRLLETQPRVHLVGTARNGAEALKMIEALQPRLVLLDFHMPRMSGALAASVIRERFPEIRVVVMSSDDN